jgi:hypothetical protein
MDCDYVMETNYAVMNLPLELSRKVFIIERDGDDSRLVEDSAWRNEYIEKNKVLFLFLLENGLLLRPEGEWPEVSSLVIRYLDLTPEGREFIDTGATDRWFGSFDRTPHKRPTDTRLLDRRLRELRGKERAAK